MSYGIKIFLKNSPSYNLDKNCTSMLISEVLYKNVYAKTGLYVPENHDYYAYLSAACGFWDEFDETAANVIVGSLDPIPYLDEKRQLCFKNGKYAYDFSTDRRVDVVGYGQQLVLLTWPKPKPTDGYGILLNGTNSFFYINQNDKLANVIWKGDIEISKKGWKVNNIDSSLSLSNSFIFFYCEDETVSIGRSDALNHRGQIIYVPYDHNGSVSSRIVKVKVVIFGTGKIKTSKYGLRIYNNKKIVYDSGNEILINPKLVSFNDSAIGQMKSIEGIKRPMFPIVSIGADYYLQQNGGWFCEIGLRSNGRQLSTTVQKTFKVWWLENILPIDSYVSEQKVMVLDAENYFKF